MEKLLEIKNLAVEYRTDLGIAKAVNHIHMTINKGEAVGLVGESGSGKTTTALSIFRLLAKPAGVITSGEITFEGKNLFKLREYEMASLRGNRMAMIFQNPLTSLNPVFTVGEQIAMVYRRHKHMNSRQAFEKAGEMLEVVGIPSSRLTEYPHQFSGGMRQRVGIASGLACDPALLVADEPTTALDVTIQIQILELIKELQQKFSSSLLMITHNLGVIAELCQKVAVMYAGTILEHGTVEEVFGRPQHPYTIGLLGSIPKISGQRDRLVAIKGIAASANNLPSGCKFYPRCAYCMEKCKIDEPPAYRMNGDHFVSCYLFEKEGAYSE